MEKIGIIFDMDGTLWDSAKNVAISWEETIKKNGYCDVSITESDIKSVMGLTMDKIADILFKFVKGDERKRLLDVCGIEENEYLRKHGAILYDGVRETFEKLREMGYHLYIVSNCQSGYIEAFLDYFKFNDLIEDIECYGNNDKPKGDNIALVMERNKLDKAVYVGDIEGDYQSSKEAGALFIHAKYGFGTISDKVPEIMKFTDLPEMIEGIWR